MSAVAICDAGMAMTAGYKDPLRNENSYSH
jgi:hypothetical protein